LFALDRTIYIIYEGTCNYSAIVIAKNITVLEGPNLNVDVPHYISEE
jgi:hypothetical protein